MAEFPYTESGSFRVRPHRPGRTATLVLVLVLLCLGGGWGMYELGREHGGDDARMSRATEARLRIRIEELRDRVGELTDRAALLERSQSIDESSFERLERQLEQREQQISHLEEELAFYRSLVSPSDEQEGIQVDRVSLFDEASNEYRYEIVLTRVEEGDTKASGDVDLIIEGNRGGETIRLGLADTRTDDGSAAGFEFSYFQAISGRLRLPEDFEPQSAHLVVTPASDGVDSVEKEYGWDSLVSGGS